MKPCSIGISLVISCAFAHNALAQIDLNTAANVAANVARDAVNTVTEGPKAAGRVIKGENPVKVTRTLRTIGSKFLLSHTKWLPELIRK